MSPPSEPGSNTTSTWTVIIVFILSMPNILLNPPMS
jgi:hypothetical protein